ncbi:MAG: zinc ribbon domain-containing protein [Blastocatellia bacterium]|nr:zinc ribbon domain-containing protein [Blastocatellia bacterium]
MVFESQLTDEMVSGKGATKHLEYSFVTQVAQSTGLPPTPLAPNVVGNGQSHVTQPEIKTSEPLPATNFVPLNGCRSCGAKLRPGTKFCSSCGTSVMPSFFVRQLGFFRQNLAALPQILRETTTGSQFSLTKWISLVVIGISICGAVSMLFPGKPEPGVSADTARLLPYLRSIVWLLFGILTALGGLLMVKTRN